MPYTLFYSRISYFQTKQLQQGIKGTRKVKSATHRILTKLLTDKFASSYNWIGSRGGKTAFSKCWIKKLLFGRAFNSQTINFCNITFITNSNFVLDTIHGLLKLTAEDDEVSEITKNWLKSSRKRIESARYVYTYAIFGQVNYKTSNYVITIYFQETRR